MAKIHVHGTKGAFVGGEWVDIEDCPDKFNVKGGSGEKCTKNCAQCPRSRSRNSASKNDGTYDVVIIGAGCIGSAIARELSKTKASVLLLEAADDVTQGATKGNSGIVHAGYDDKPGTMRAKFCWKGNQMFPQLDRELHFGYEKTGSLVIARDESELAVLDELMERGKKNGVERLRIVQKEEVFKLEPNIHPDTIAALLAPDAGSLIPYEYAVALAENAVDNGVEVRIRREVESISKSDLGFDIKVRHWEPACYTRKGSFLPAMSAAALPVLLALILNVALPEAMAGNVLVINAIAVSLSVLLTVMSLPKSHPKTQGEGKGINVASWIEAMKVGGSGSSNGVDGETVDYETVKTRYVVNCAGCASDKIAAMIGDDSFYIKPRLGEYLLLHKNQGNKTNHIIFPTPHPVKGKGVLVQKTLWGNLILGPTARDITDDITAKEPINDIMTYILSKCRELVPSFDASDTIHAFCGARAKSSKGDWIIEASPADSRGRFINAAGIDSPGLAGSPAIALYVVELLKEKGLSLEKDPTFNPLRAPIIVPKDGRNLKYSKTEADARGVDPAKNVVCKCEKVTEAEIIEACRRSLPVDSTQAMRKRTRAGMGHCQGDPDNYDCESRVAAIIARETGLPLSAVGRRPWPATSMLPSRWPTAAEKKEIDQLGKA
eukprot:TRINITY_DN76285_c0_g1_i1.p1 TRINITY_DN76285_c0_g1~~TRINITY_DN76285_c0_g1_i1.p1  ORF type:complete len:663 (-),score=110.89 TRINITY_DN76285_c0_g1_i1:198-2186(-)